MKRLPNVSNLNPMESSDRESEYNYNCSNEGSPEHNIHTVVVGVPAVLPDYQPKQLPTATSFSQQKLADVPEEHRRKVIRLVDSPSSSTE